MSSTPPCEPYRCNPGMGKAPSPSVLPSSPEPVMKKNQTKKNTTLTKNNNRERENLFVFRFFVVVFGLVFVGKGRDNVDILLHLTSELVPQVGGVNVSGDGQLPGLNLRLQTLHAFNKNV